ncbi:hypothetical protein ASPZODRAFT_25768 [Penicilliopsis zonata CBS 506.65]|uniref:Ubiquitin 3 binding protein But2 C-terminal domain-containing protein n=1 Tax=Penicilliopsis zonata CBS 506.65 TaxID=1073090 RepID=A0A1L9SHK9_9EURO|nr:hypothetical protein ASPZODRAFT_25768 [Penicilliopsis zonata CBS 506.65]OJJ46699.1 hypothetical protein ASPZODRAFT_25768 [Penicilliopsis zonata CBS 506.65]
MKTSVILAALSLASATPIASSSAVFEVSITFNGVNGASFSQNFPADDSLVAITNPLNVSSIASVGGGFCTFTGVDGSSVVLDGEQTVSVSPPQPQKWGSCQTA